MVYYKMFSHLELPQLGLSQSQMHLKVYEENATLESSMIANYGKCYNHLKDTSLYLPIYPRVNGRTLSVQGDKLVTSPAPKMTAKLQGRGQGQSENGRTWNIELFIQHK
jgi:hypothetical protein